MTACECCGAEITAEVREPGHLPEYVRHPLLGRSWDRDEVLSAFLVQLPVSIQQKLLGAWSIERTAGPTPHLRPDGLRFVGPGRTVILDIRRSPGVPPDRFLDLALGGSPPVPDDQRFRTRDGAEPRHARWLTTSPKGMPQHEFFGHVVRPVTCSS